MSDKPKPWVITYAEFAKYLSEVGRTGKCPVCPHYGDWTFHVLPSSAESGSPVMLLNSIPAYDPAVQEKPLARLAYLAMECPRCAFTQFTSVAAVAKHLGRELPGPTDE